MLRVLAVLAALLVSDSAFAQSKLMVGVRFDFSNSASIQFDATGPCDVGTSATTLLVCPVPVPASAAIATITVSPAPVALTMSGSGLLQLSGSAGNYTLATASAVNSNRTVAITLKTTP